MVHYAVIDTNVLVSALLSKNDDAATVKVLESIFDGTTIPLYSNITMQEYKEVLIRPKFKFNQSLISYIISAIEQYGILIEPNSYDVILPDMDDLPFYEIYLEKRDDFAYLATGNIKHFIKEPFIVAPAEFLEIIKNKNYKS